MTEGGGHDHRRHLLAHACGRLLDECDAVELGHLPIDQDKVVTQALLAERHHVIDGGTTFGKGIHLDALLLEGVSEDLARVLHIVDQQSAQAEQIADEPGLQRLILRLFVEAERQAHMKAAALAGRAFDPDLAVHHRHQALADRQPQAGAAVLAGG